MKRLMLMVMALAVASLAAWGDIKLTGTTTYGAAVEPATLLTKHYVYQALTLTGDAVSAFGDMSTTTDAFAIGTVCLTLDLAKQAKLKQGMLTFRGGKLGVSDTMGNAAISGYGFEGKAGLGPVTVKVGALPLIFGQWMAGANVTKTIGPVAAYAEAYYDANGKAVGEGLIALDAQAKPTFGKVVVQARGGARIDMGADTVAWDARVSGAYGSYLTLAVVASGGGTAAPFGAASLWGQAGYTIGLVDLKAYGKVQVYPAILLLSVDVCALFNIGAADLYAGAVYKAANWAFGAFPTLAPWFKVVIAY